MQTVHLDTMPIPGAELSAFLHDVSYLSLAEVPGMAAMHCRFRIAAYDDAWFGALGVARPDTLARAVPKRKAEYLAARYLCQLLLAERGLPTAVGSGQHRQPLWPEGWTGTITHSDETAVVALAPSGEGLMLGLDLERWMSDKTADNVHEGILVPGEREALAGPRPFPHALTLAFSAKESLFKALYPRVGQYFDFNAAEMTRVDWDAGRFSIRLLKTLAPGLEAGRAFDGSFHLRDGQVLTLIAAF
ncbi:4'-phosphopantetheinyl transferase superfamily protein [Chromobacterium violaceum]|uniref:4'-phosphopantetheinyl transferase family protein n=1 Tax=Chromobacterium violaceum TaxID=536 RepID=UPI001B3284A4|nr:4'-phosphopantetheinyl transferase superfamily protein [Chromobacterium violaceum]MBP4049400.1 4'-phosphopantetheinyl transferase superfamily protein [Chromobacterium violaceum]